MRLVLLRHGRTEATEKRLYCGSTDLPLTEAGIGELRQTAEECEYPVGKKYYTSGMLRAEQTLEAIYGAVPHTVIPELRETDFGQFEMRGYADDLQFDPAFRQWCDAYSEDTPFPGGESASQTAERALRGLKPILCTGVDAVCVTHGGVIADVMEKWFPGSPDRYAFTPRPGCGYEILVEQGVPVEYCFIPKEK